MILTVIVLIFTFRIRYPIFSFLVKTKTEIRKHDIAFLCLVMLFVLLVLMFGIHFPLFSIPICILFFELGMLLYFQNAKHHKVRLGIEHLLKMSLFRMRNGVSLHTSINESLLEIEVLKQHNIKNMIHSVLFAQQKPGFRGITKDLREFFRVLDYAQKNKASSKDILSFYLSNLLVRRKIGEKKSALTQNIRAQVIVSSLLYVCLLGFQFYFLEIDQVLAWVFLSVTFFGIGIFSLLTFMWFYI